MRQWRKSHPLTKTQKLRSSSRAYANSYKKRGKIQVQCCEVCGAKAEMHHDDYSKPLRVRWFCRQHHLEFHRK